MRLQFRGQCKRAGIDFFFYVWLFFLLAGFGWLWEGFLYLSGKTPMSIAVS